MAESTDVCNAIAGAVSAIIVPLVDTTYTILEAVDAAAVGAEQTIPNTTIAVSRPLQKDLEDRLAAGKAIITVEPDESDSPAQQYANEGKRQDLLSRTAITLVATRTSFTSWTLSGTATVGNIIGIQVGARGATYVIEESDNPTTIVAALAASAIEAGIAGHAAGAVFSLTTSQGNASLQIGATSLWLQAVARRVRSFDVIFWMPDPYLRQQLVRVTESVFRPGQKLTLPDQSEATVLGTAGTGNFNTRISDANERDNLFIARTRWLIDFTVTRTVTKAPVVASTVVLDTMPIDITAPLLASQL